jgi:hypothetical protein
VRGPEVPRVEIPLRARQPPWPVRPRCHRRPQRFFGLTALPHMWQRILILGQLPGCPVCGRRRPARPKSKFLSLL